MRKAKPSWMAKHSDYKYEYETHYFYDARMGLPSIVRSHSKTEEGARRACVQRVDFEQYNKAVIVHLRTGEILQVYRRDPRTGDIQRKNHVYEAMAGYSMSEIF